MKSIVSVLFTAIYALLLICLLFLQYYNGQRLFLGILQIILTLLLSYPVVRILFRKNRKDRDRLIEKIYFERNTGLPNREKLRLDAVKDDSVLFLLNIDSFKEVNDFYGNNVGDVVLHSLAERLKALGKSTISRLFDGGELYKLETDEFAFLFSYSMDEARVRRIAEVIIENINARPFQVQDTDITITITLGVASVAHREILLEVDKRTPGILAQADMALKKAKDKRVSYLIYNHSMEIPKEYEENIRWTHEVKQSIEEDRVIPYFQPIINNATGGIEKFECLMRIIDTDENLIYPDRFLKISKRSRQYPTLSRIMLRKVIHEMKETSFEYSFNISVEDIRNRDTVEFVNRILHNHKDVAPRICFEILESENIIGVPEVPEFIKMVKEYGCSIALDDFGTGYSNFNYIMSLDVDIIKIDASIIKNLDKDDNAMAIAETIVDFAERTGTTTIAEFVHSEEIYSIVKSLGVAYSQGFYLGEPRPSTIQSSSSTIA